jgi:hypothetical protein
VHVSKASARETGVHDKGIRLCSAALMLAVCACSGNRSGSGAATAPSTSVLVVGIVRGEAPPANRIPVTVALAGVHVSVIAGPATGTTATTDSDGNYRLQLPPGTFKLRWSKPGYLPFDSADTIAVGPRSMDDVVLRTAPWAIVGRATDSLGNPVEGVSITFGNPGLAVHGSVTTDAGGGYRFVSSQPRYSALPVNIQKDGYEPPDIFNIACCASDGDTRFDVRLRRIVAVTIEGPGTLGVGEGAPLPINDIMYDDGSHQTIRLFPTSSDPSVVAVERAFMDTQDYGLRGVRPGTAVISCDWRKFFVQLQVRVVDR